MPVLAVELTRMRPETKTSSPLLADRKCYPLIKVAFTQTCKLIMKCHLNLDSIYFFLFLNRQRPLQESQMLRCCATHLTLPLVKEHKHISEFTKGNRVVWRVSLYYEGVWSDRLIRLSSGSSLCEGSLIHQS